MIYREMLSSAGYAIPFISNIKGNEKKVCVFAHGFASSKNSSTAAMMADFLEKYGIASVIFDFPCHGDSHIDYSDLRVENCVRDMRSIENWAYDETGGAEICYFASSFGALMTICYLSRGWGRGKEVFLRCAAVDMDKSFGVKTDEVMAQIKKQGYYVYDEGFGHPLKLTELFFDELSACDAFKMDMPRDVKVQMLHGCDDEEVDPNVAADYAAVKGYPITLIDGAGHAVDNPEGIKAMFELSKKLFVHE